MKPLLFIGLLFATSNILAESTNPFESMQTQDMQGMMMNMQKIQSCMANINQDELLALGKQAKGIQEKIQKECDAGNAKAAQKTAMDFASILKSSKAAEQAQLCLKDLPEMMKGHLPGTDINQLQNKLEQNDVCSIKLP